MAKAVIEEASLHKIGDLFPKKPPGLKINETEAIVVTAKTEDGTRVTRTFYFCLKPDGTFYEDSIAKDGSRARRHRLASFIRYYNIIVGRITGLINPISIKIYKKPIIFMNFIGNIS